MGYQTRRAFCGVLFWMKVLLSLSMACAFLAYLSLRVYDKHSDGVNRARQTLANKNNPITIDASNPVCSADASNYMRLEPSDGLTYMGYSLNWAQDTPTTVFNRLNRRMAVANAFTLLDMTSSTKQFDTNMVNWFGQQMAETGGILELTIESTDVTLITDDMYNQIATQLASINSKYGVPIILRWCHEMNGDWTSYGYKPALYKASFIKMTQAVRARTNMTSMLWSPNVGIAYPFSAPSDAQSPPPTATNDKFNQFALLDTNKDGVLDFLDDPYLPYYPGNEYVDWVGLSLYYYQDGTRNQIPDPTFMNDYLTGTGPAADKVYPANGAVDRNLRNFYNRFVLGTATDNKPRPLALSESGAPYVLNWSGATELQIKTAWWQQTLSPAIKAAFPMMKLIVNFEERKKEEGVTKDWANTVNSTILAAYNDYLNTYDSKGYVWGGSQLSYTCGGVVAYTG